MNIFSISFEVFDKLVSVYNILVDFLFQPIYIGFNGINILGANLFAFGFTLDMWALLGGSGLILILTFSLAKKYLPFL